MLVAIYPYNLEPEECASYVEARMLEIGVQIDVIESEFVQDNDEGAPSHFTHHMIVANIPTLEKFFEAVCTFERDGWVSIEGYGDDYERWGYDGIELVDKSHEKYYSLPCLTIEVRGGVFY